MERPALKHPSDPGHRSSDIGIYVHIPFCSAICNYCNFNRGLYDEALKTRYVAALRAEISRAGSKDPAYSPGASKDAPYNPKPNDGNDAVVGRVFRPGKESGANDAVVGRVFRPGKESDANDAVVGRVFRPAGRADTIFFGGGTPSLLEPQEIGDLIRTVRETFALNPDAEITLETNPETVDRAKLERFREAGVNRLSFGVQSFQDAELRRLGRIHSADRARAAVREARAAGFDNVSLDLMMWLPGQDVATWLRNVEALIAAEPDHASLYLLELYPNAPLKEDMARAGWSLAPDDDAAEMYLRAMETLETAGLEQYEISNVARSGRASRHNVKYWTDGEWLAFGCGAHSTRAGIRWKNVSGTGDYIDRVTAGLDLVAERRTLTLEERLEEALFTGLRLTRGVDLAIMRERYGVDVWDKYGAQLQPFIDASRLVREGTHLRLTREGMLTANDVMAVFV